MTVCSPISLPVIRLTPEGDITLALQVKLVSTMLNGDKVRLLLNIGWEPVMEASVTCASLLDSSVSALNHIIFMSSRLTLLSVAEFRNVVHIRVKEDVPAYRGPGGTVIHISGVETVDVGMNTNISYKCYKTYFEC